MKKEILTEGDRVTGIKLLLSVSETLLIAHALFHYAENKDVREVDREDAKRLLEEI